MKAELNVQGEGSSCHLGLWLEHLVMPFCTILSQGHCTAIDMHSQRFQVFSLVTGLLRIIDT